MVKRKGRVGTLHAGTFEISFQPLIQLNSIGLLYSFVGEQPGLSRTIGIIVYVDVAAFKRG